MEKSKTEKGRYARLLQDAEASGRTQMVTPTFLKWEKVGQVVVGRLVSRSVVTSSKGPGTYNMYVMDTDDGLIKFSLGAVTDRNLMNVFSDGEVFVVRYDGQDRTPNGNHVNKFTVRAVVETGTQAETSSDVPF